MTEPSAPAEADDDASVAVPVQRAGTLVTLAGMTGIAVLVCAVLVVWMRSSGPAEVAAPETGMETEVPASLVAGIDFGAVPAEIVAAVDEPVVAAVVLSELPQDLAGCGWGELVDPELERAYALPDAVVLSQVGEMNPDMMGGFREGPVPMPVPEPPPDVDVTDEGFDDEVGVLPDVDEPRVDQLSRWRETCVARHANGSWITDLNSSGPADDHGFGFGASMTCCDGGFATALTMIDVPDEAAWALQDRGVYWLAYPVEDGHRQLPITWRYRETSFGRAGRSTHVLLLDPSGEIVSDRYIDV